MQRSACRQRSRREWQSALAVLSCALSLAACSTSLGPGSAATAAIGDTQGAAKQQKSAKIAMLLPLAGMDQTSVIAKAMKQAGEMALFELDNPYVHLVVKDTKGAAGGARAAAEQALAEGAEIIIGPLFARDVGEVAPVARAANVPVLTFSNDRQVAGGGVYLMSFLAEQEVDRVVSFAAGQGKRRFAALIPDSAYGQIIEPAFRTAVVRAGGEIVALERYPLQANGMLEPAKRVVDRIKQEEALGAPVDALFLSGGQESLPRLGPLIAYSGVDPGKVRLLGTGVWDFPNIGHDTTFVGGWYPGPEPHGWQQFSERFARAFGSAPPRIASLAYDAVSLSVALSTNLPGQRYTAASITRPAGFIGIDGLVRFTPDGLSERSLAVLTVQKFAPEIADPAPIALGSAQVSTVSGQQAN